MENTSISTVSVDVSYYFDKLYHTYFLQTIKWTCFKKL